MRELIISMDLDDVLWDFNTPFAAWSKERFGSTVTYDQIDTFDLLQVYDISREEFNRRTQEFCHNHHDTIPVFEAAIKFLQAIQPLGFKVHGLTSRWDSLREITLRHIETHVPAGLITDVHFANGHHEHHGDKSEISQQLGAVLHIEDAWHHAESMDAIRIATLLHDKPWNQRHIAADRLIYRQGNWREPALAWEQSEQWVVDRFGQK